MTDQRNDVLHSVGHELHPFGVFEDGAFVRVVIMGTDLENAWEVLMSEKMLMQEDLEEMGYDIRPVTVTWPDPPAEGDTP